MLSANSAPSYRVRNVVNASETRAPRGLDRMKSPVSIPAAILIYLLIGPAVGTLVFLLDMGLPFALWRETTAVLLVIGFGYIGGAIPAIGAACFGTLLGARPLWQRLLLPAFSAGGLTEFVMVLILRADWSANYWHLRSALALAGFAGALAAAGVLELWRHRLEARMSEAP